MIINIKCWPYNTIIYAYFTKISEKFPKAFQLNMESMLAFKVNQSRDMTFHYKPNKIFTHLIVVFCSYVDLDYCEPALIECWINDNPLICGLFGFSFIDMQRPFVCRRFRPFSKRLLGLIFNFLFGFHY